MAFETPITIKEAVENIHRKKYLLPAIQREVVWEVSQIECLFDSLMRNYPIGSFLFWYVEKQRANNYRFNEFLREYHEKDNSHNPKASLSGQDDVIGILDGQQRLTSLYIGLMGSYAYKEPRKRWDNPLAFPTRYLYLNLLSPKQTQSDTDVFYDFSFRTNEESQVNDDDTFWFKVCDILDIKNHAAVNKFLIHHGLLKRDEQQADYANETLFQLWSIVHDRGVISYFLEKDESLDKVLNIFIRVNSGGTVLSYSDLLLSIATAQWQHRDAKEEIISFVDEINGIGDGFNFDKDFVLKSSLVLTDFGDIAFKVDNFTRKNMLKIEEEWETITDSLRGAIRLVSGFGYGRDTLTANYAIIPIAYYLKQKGLPPNFDTAVRFAEDRKAIRRWLILALVKRSFGGAPDSVLRPTREVLRQNADGFPLDEITNKFKGTSKSLVITEDDIENILCYRYGQGYTFSTLALIFPSFDFRNKFHIDHIHPRSHFTRAKLRRREIPESDIDFYLDNVNLLPNLQLLEGVPNQEKSDSDFGKWVSAKFSVDTEAKDYMKANFIPDENLSLSNFKNFFLNRKELMRGKLESLLEV